MKNKFLLNLLLISNVFCFENVESKIENFFSLVQNKTINLIIKNNETKINSNLSIDGDIIFSATSGTEPIVNNDKDLMLACQLSALCVTQAVGSAIKAARKKKGDQLSCWFDLKT